MKNHKNHSEIFFLRAIYKVCKISKQKENVTHIKLVYLLSCFSIELYICDRYSRKS